MFKKASNVIEKGIAQDKDLCPLLLYVTGLAGSSKSFLLKRIVEHMKRCYAPTVDTLLKTAVLEVASLTGVAAKQISGRTLHSCSVFSLRT